MARDQEPDDDLHEGSNSSPADVPIKDDWRDEPLIQDRRVQMSLDEVDDLLLPDPEEPLALVDTPVQLRKPFTRREKRRNHRPLPTRGDGRGGALR